MPRKSKQIDGRRKRIDLRTVDKNSKKYWDELLRRDGLAMTAGYKPRKLVYVGATHTLEGVAGGVDGHTRRTGPKKQAD